MNFLNAASVSLYGCAKRIERCPIREIRKQLRGDAVIEYFDENNWKEIPTYYPEANETYTDWEPI